MNFIEFPKIARLKRDIIITEKLDGTNAQVYIRELPDDEVMPTDTPIVAVHGNLLLYAGSRTRWITPEDDNYGFAKWVKQNSENLALLGPGSHFGEWWGQGIQRKYGLAEKRFSLFNVGRWVDWRSGVMPGDKQTFAPECCHVVPILWQSEFDSTMISYALDSLAEYGSKAAPGFMKPEGIVLFHTASGHLYKQTIEKDESPKGVSK